eukprot:6010519-Pleurochrysis_carterae.AAC.4
MRKPTEVPVLKNGQVCQISLRWRDQGAAMPSVRNKQTNHKAVQTSKKPAKSGAAHPREQRVK